MLNGARKAREKKLVETVKNVLEICEKKAPKCACDGCDKTFETHGRVKTNKNEKSCNCDGCCKIFETDASVRAN